MRSLGSKYFSDLYNIDDISFLNITIEGPKNYWSFVSGLSDHSCKSLIISDKEGPLSLEGNAEVISDLFNLSFDDKKIDNLLQRKLVSIYESSHKEEKLDHISDSVYDLFKEISQDLNIGITFREDLSIKDFIKILCPTINVEYTSKLEMFVEYLKLINEIKSIDVFIFLNLKSIFTKEDLQAFSLECQYHKFHIINLEPYRTPFSIESEVAKVIDSDLCEIE
ncbi:MAG: type II-A CRISPR-associated protein Csn2 [Bacilli bacterium]|jgi:CRISPR type II-A-associated protein Csn2|nr:type II-A CRISPR-associated protein Csn2 [Bacilli bacterium]